ncbi:MAG TPA: methyltransferase domain-containing protein [Thermoleophilaceae bacterium]
MTPALAALQASLAERLAELRGVPVSDLPEELLDVVVRPFDLPGGEVYLVKPADWEALRDEEGMAPGRPLPYWARLWPSGIELAMELAAHPPGPGTKVIELGCGLGLASVVAGRGGAAVLATDGHGDAVAFAAHNLALNELEATVACADMAQDADALVERGPFDLVLAADVLYTVPNADALLTLVPRLLEPNGELWLGDPDRAGGRRFLSAARSHFHVRTREGDEVKLHKLRPR